MDTAFFQSFNIHLDLALEAREIIQGKTGQEIPGVRVDKETYDFASVTTVHIEEKDAEQIMGKPVGSYVTIESSCLKENDPQNHHQLGELLGLELSTMIQLPEDASVLVVGLGNWKATPDALGPKVVNMTMVTRHIFQYAPQELTQGMRRVSAIAPGVLGLTGIETAEIIKGIVEKIQPNLIIAIDSLGSRSVARIGTTIQIANTGVNPGSGVGNQRKALTKETLGIPVIAIGIPTVVNAAVIAKDTIDAFMNMLQNNQTVYNVVQTMNPHGEEQVINQILEPFGGNLMVTPKEIDDLIQRAAKIVAGGITKALHPNLDPQEYEYYLN